MTGSIYTLTIVLNLHHEGAIARKTLENLVTARKIGMKRWADIEIIAILDRSDEETVNIIQEYDALFALIEEVDYGDLAHSRNHGVSRASNHFVLFADGDDFISEKALIALYERLEKHYKQMGIRSVEALQNAPMDRHAAIFPKFLVEFPSLLKTTYFDLNDCIRLNNRFVHLYISRICTYNEVLHRYPLRPNEPPYGYEDWDLNNRLIAAGVHYLTADYTIYYRKNQSGSLLSNQVKNLAIVRNSEIYSYDFDRSHHCEEINRSTKRPNHNLRTKLLTKLHELKTKDSYLKRRLKNIRAARRLYERITERLKPEQARIAGGEDLFAEDITFLRRHGEKWERGGGDIYDLSHYTHTFSIHSRVYKNLLYFFYDREILFFVPWIEMGGADKVIVQYTDAVKMRKSALVTTLCSGERIDRIPIDHIDLPFIPHWHDLIEHDRLHILIKAIINSGVKVVHVVNSELALKLVKYYGKVFKEHDIRLLVSFFGPDINWTTMEYHGYPIDYKEAYHYADTILSDNEYWYDFFKKVNEGEDFPFKKIPVAVESVNTYAKHNTLTRKIVWASRICNIKLFYLLEKIADALPDYHFVIYGGFIEGNNDKILERLKKRSNVEYRGAFHTFEELDLNEFDLFLFTSKSEGIPNIVLEMAKSGIPMVASDVGGVHEVLGDDYPLLVHDVENTDEYVQKIRYFYDHLEEIYQWAEKIKTFVETVHTHEHFNREYRTLIETLIEDRSR